MSDEMAPHRFTHEGSAFEIAFERRPTGWIGRIHRDGGDTGRAVEFADGIGYAADDVRASLVAGCEAAVAGLVWPSATRH